MPFLTRRLTPNPAEFLALTPLDGWLRPPVGDPLGGNDTALISNLSVLFRPQLPSWSLPQVEDVYLLGGNDGKGWLDAVDVFTPARDSWRSAPAMPIERGYGEAVPLDGRIYVVGGGNGVEWLDSVLRLDPRQGWQQVRSQHASQGFGFEGMRF